MTDTVGEDRILALVKLAEERIRTILHEYEPLQRPIVSEREKR